VVSSLTCDYCDGMSLWQAAGWALAGGLAAAILGLMTAVTVVGFKWPWKKGELRPRLFVVGCGLLLGILVACAAHSQMTGGWPAFVLGAAAPAAIRGLLSGVQVHAEPDPRQHPARRSVPIAEHEPEKRGEISESKG
jgi:hypothetical protein